MKRLLFLAATMCIASHAAIADTEWLSPETLMKLEVLYLGRLDAWVNAGGDVRVIQEEVVGNCGKLFYMHVEPAKITSLSAEERNDYDTLIDVCTKITVNRVHAQPEFENPKTVKLICIDMAAEHPAIAKLCDRAKL